MKQVDLYLANQFRLICWRYACKYSKAWMGYGYTRLNIKRSTARDLCLWYADAARLFSSYPFGHIEDFSL